MCNYIKNDFLKNKKTNINRKNLKISNKIENHKKIICELCYLFLEESNENNLKDIILKINDFIHEKEKMERIFYSELSSFIFTLPLNQRGLFSTNVDRVLYEVCEQPNFIFKIIQTNDNKLKEDIVKILIKFYDHSHLVLYQIENSYNIIANTISESKNEIKEDVKKIEREYITILGIFASIMLAFVSGLTFSTSVLENMHKVSIYKLIFVISLLSLTLMTIFYYLINFIISINDFKTKIKNEYFKTFFLFIIIILVLDFGAWVFNLKLYQKQTINTKIQKIINS